MTWPAPNPATRVRDPHAHLGSINYTPCLHAWPCPHSWREHLCQWGKGHTIPHRCECGQEPAPHTPFVPQDFTDDVWACHNRGQQP